MAVTYIGMLHLQTSYSSDAGLPCAEAKAIPSLVPCEKQIKGDTRMRVLALKESSTFHPLKLWTTSRESHKRIYYVCTMNGCDWSGSGRKRHSTMRPRCPSVPCTMDLQQPKGNDVGSEVAKFMARCTPQQVAHRTGVTCPPPSRFDDPPSRIDPSCHHSTACCPSEHQPTTCKHDCGLG